MKAAVISHAVEILRRGGLVALPTETVYGLAADAENEIAVRRIFAAKGRPVDHPLIVHLASARQITEWARDIPEEAWKLATAFWPGPLTMVLRRSDKAADVVTGGLETIGLRVPLHPLAIELLTAFGGGLAAPSANRFGRVSPTTAEHVEEELGDEVDLILDGGPCEIGLESTIVDLSTGEPTLLRWANKGSTFLEFSTFSSRQTPSPSREKFTPPCAPQTAATLRSPSLHRHPKSDLA
jgi:L-threonylcarbamoyladenylate synthase